MRSGGRSHKYAATDESIRQLEGEDRRQRFPPQEILTRMGLSPEETVLDLGAGVGVFSFPMANTGSMVIALDIEPKMLAALRERIERRQSGEIALLRGDILAIPLRQGAVDRVMAAFVYHEVTDRRLLMLEAARVLRPNGRLTVVEHRKRIITTHGPPFWVRRTARDVERNASPWFSVESISKGKEYYQVELRRRPEKGHVASEGVNAR